MLRWNSPENICPSLFLEVEFAGNIYPSLYCSAGVRLKTYVLLFFVEVKVGLERSPGFL